VKIYDLLDVELLGSHVEARLVSETAHPTEPLVIYNYTQTCQYTGRWDDVTKRCRGLIVNSETQEVVARPFSKFFNLGEHHGGTPAAGPLNLQPPLRVYDKMDGSLGIAYRLPSTGALAWATRGSFFSEQAAWATEYWNERYDMCELDENFTWLAEIIYPQNRIVVDYGNYASLVLLSIIDTETGLHHETLELKAQWPVDHVDFFGEATDPETVDPNDRTGAEGYVILSGDGVTRVKVKADEYVRLHRLVTGVSSRTIWEMLSSGAPLEELYEKVPDEFSDWVNQTVDSLNNQFREIVETVTYDFIEVLHRTDHLTREQEVDRRQFAEVAKETQYPGLLFALLDNKDISARIWKMVKPEWTLPFRKDE